MIPIGLYYWNYFLNKTQAAEINYERTVNFNRIEVLSLNLIWCSKPCVYQSEGLCTLEKLTAPTANNGQGCCYFVSNEKQSKSENSGLHFEN